MRISLGRGRRTSDDGGGDLGVDPVTGYGRPSVRTELPLNVEADLSLGHDLLTPPGRHFIRSHFATPAVLDGGLVIDGEVEREVALSMADLRAMATETAQTTIECAGNSRAQLEPPVNGVQWVAGAVSTALWGGVPLARLLAMAGIRAGADGVLLRGADRGEVPDGRGGRRSVHFERSLPLEKALGPEVLIVTAMDGKTLPVEHGGPLRAVVGGWYGMASVKWLTRVTLTRHAPAGFWESVEYAYDGSDADGVRTRVPVREMLPKAQVTEPAPGASVRLGQPVLVRGYAWAGEAAVSHVEISDDGGAGWSAVRVLDEPRPRLWSRWEFDWCPDRAGQRALLVRCHDDRGRSQPLTRDGDRGTYMINEVTPYPVNVLG
ncbi:MAG TPA: molybdopterin-dependent oxidoreductase [Candidatus Limnocylindrales bacterium]|nr:molybdopterin-dependent oxidoreductase [Candidatus Limnocylindrales bacterium]